MHEALGSIYPYFCALQDLAKCMYLVNPLMHGKSLPILFHTLSDDLTVPLKIFYPPSDQDNLHYLGGDAVSTCIHLPSNASRPLEHDNNHMIYHRQAVVGETDVASSGTMREKK